MRYFLLRGLLLIFVLVVSVSLLVEERLGSASVLRAAQVSAVLAGSDILALNGLDSGPGKFSVTAFPKEREVVRQRFADDIRLAEHPPNPSGSVIIPIALVD